MCDDAAVGRLDEAASGTMEHSGGAPGCAAWRAESRGVVLSCAALRGVACALALCCGAERGVVRALARTTDPVGASSGGEPRTAAGLGVGWMGMLCGLANRGAGDGRTATGEGAAYKVSDAASDYSRLP